MRLYGSCNDDVPCEPDVDCKFNDWSEWSACSAECAGVKRRARNIASQGEGNGQFCVGPLKENAPCNPSVGEAKPAACLENAPVNCELGGWNVWSECSKPCGGGSHTRTRDITRYPENFGIQCNSTLGEVEPCNRAPCSSSCTPQDCLWSDWGQWSACDKCGGQMRRFRHITQESQCGGSACDVGASEEAAACPRKCHEAAYCMWGDWDGWSSCSATCGSAEKSRTRHLMLTAAPPVDHILGGNTELDETFLETSVLDLKMRTQGMRTRRLQELIVAFTCGGVSLVVGFAVVRAVSRVGRSRSTPVDSWYNEGPL